MQKPLDNSQNLFEKRYVVKMPTVVEEFIILKSQPFGSMRRFMKRGDEWYLIYYILNARISDEKAPSEEVSDPNHPKEIHLDVRPQSGK